MHARRTQLWVVPIAVAAIVVHFWAHQRWSSALVIGVLVALVVVAAVNVVTTTRRHRLARRDP